VCINHRYDNKDRQAERERERQTNRQTDRQTDRQTSPRCESAQCPLVSGSAITTFTPGNNYKHSPRSCTAFQFNQIFKLPLFWLHLLKVCTNSTKLWYKKHIASTLPDSIRQRLCGDPFSTKVTRSLRKARRSTYTVEASGFEALYHTYDQGRI